MSSNAYHLQCYTRVTGRTAKGRTFAARPAGPSSIPCKGCETRIYVGDAFTWTRDNENGKRHGSPRESKDGSIVDVDAPEIEATDDEPSETHEQSNEQPKVELAPPSNISPIAREILREIKPHLPTANVDRHQVIDIARREIQISIEEAAEKIKREIEAPTRIEIKAPSGEVKDMGLQHKQFPLLLSMLAAGVNVWITGPAGSGKTTAAHNAAIALGREYAYTGSSSDAVAVTGYMGPHGYVSTAFRRSYESAQPSLHLLDEVDGWDPNALLALNAALANGTASFPDKMVTRGDCLLVGCANTVGHGATQEYCGRMRQDFAFLDRWTILQWEVDEDLEIATSGNERWARRVQKVRARVKESGIKVLITPRSTYRGARMLAQGIDQHVVETCELASRMTADQWAKVSR